MQWNRWWVWYMSAVMRDEKKGKKENEGKRREKSFIVRSLFEYMPYSKLQTEQWLSFPMFLFSTRSLAFVFPDWLASIQPAIDRHTFPSLALSLLYIPHAAIQTKVHAVRADVPCSIHPHPRNRNRHDRVGQY